MKKILSVILAALMIASVLAVPAFADDTPTDKEIQDIFRILGVSTWGSGYFGADLTNPAGEPATPAVVHQYLQSAGLIKDYEYTEEVTTEWGTYEAWGYELPYSTYMKIIDDNFVNHTDMKDYLNNQYSHYYNEETGMVKWQSGGFGGPTSWVVNEIYRASENYIYATGIMIDYGYDESDFDGLTLNKDYVIYDGNKAKIFDKILLTLVKEDGKWKIFEYRENSYYIVDDVLYDAYEDVQFNRLTIEKSGVKITEDGSRYEQYTTGFFANGSKWYNAGQTLCFSVTPRRSYEIIKVVLKDANGETVIAEKDGLYEITPKGAAKLYVVTAKTPIAIAIEQPAAQETIKVSAENTEIFAVADQSVTDIIEAVSEDVEIVKADGTKAEADDKIASGMQIVIKDEDGVVVDTKTVVVPGDVDGDAEINASDARSALRNSVGLDDLESWGSAAANVDGEAGVSAADARSILRASVGLDDSKDWLATIA